MSGHSKWSQIKRQKARTDAQRGRIFSKIVREITVAVRHGGPDPNSNSRLRLVLDKARQANMPADNIERAIKKASGPADSVRLEELTYEGYGPGGAAILVTALTDNRNRTSGDVKSIFAKHGGNLGESGCVGWLFTKQGLLSFDREKVKEEEILNIAGEAGAEDVRSEEKIIEVITGPAEYEKVREAFVKQGFSPVSAEMSMVPANTVIIDDLEVAEKLLKLMEALEENDDLSEVYSNFNINDEVLKKLGKV
jgi:YebC/PmpR family DNA-binding regulatory protein